MDYWNFFKNNGNSNQDFDPIEQSTSDIRHYKSDSNKKLDNEQFGEDYIQKINELQILKDSLDKQVKELDKKNVDLTLQIEKLKREIEEIKGAKSDIENINKSQQEEITKLEIKLKEYKAIIQSSGTLIDNANKSVEQIVSECKKLLVLGYQSEEASIFMEHFFMQCTKILNKQGFIILNAVNGMFDPSKQDAISVLKTDDSSLSGTVAASVRIGFYNEKTGECEHQKVIIYQ